MAKEKENVLTGKQVVSEFKKLDTLENCVVSPADRISGRSNVEFTASDDLKHIVSVVFAGNEIADVRFVK